MGRAFGIGPGAAFGVGFCSGLCAGLAAAGVDESLPVAVGLVGVVGGEAGDGVVEARGGADVAGDGAGVSGAGVAAGEGFAADGCVLDQAGGLERGELDRAFVVVELAAEVVAALDGAPAEKGAGLELHGALAVDDSEALVARHCLLPAIGRVGGV